MKDQDQITQLTRQATAFRSKLDHPRASEAYRALAALDPANPVWPHREGEALRAMGQLQQAVEALERAADRYLEQGFVLKAIAVCKMILGLDPANTRTQERLLVLHQQNPHPRRTGEQERVAREVAPSAPVEPAPRDTVQQPMAPINELELELEQGQPEQEQPAADQAEAPRRRSSDTLEEIPLTVVLPDARPADAEPTDNPVFEIRLDDIWVEVAEDDVVDQEPDEQWLLDQMPAVELLSSLTTDELRSFIDKVSVEEYQQGEAIIRQGAWGDTLYVLVEGTVGIFCQEHTRVVTLGMLSEGAFFGEFALLTNLKRSATVEAMEACTVIAISRKVVRELVAEHPPVLKVLLSFFRDRMIRLLTTNHPLFQPFVAYERRELVGQFHFLEAPADRVLVHEGQQPDGLYLLVCGEAVAERRGGAISALRMGDMFCKTALLFKAVSINTVRTTSKCWLLWMPRDKFREVIMTHPQVLATITEAEGTGKHAVEQLDVDQRTETPL